MPVRTSQLGRTPWQGPLTGTCQINDPTILVVITTDPTNESLKSNGDSVDRFSFTTMSDEHPLDRLLTANAKWAAEITAQDPEFFANLSQGQTPKVRSAMRIV